MGRRHWQLLGVLALLVLVISVVVWAQPGHEYTASSATTLQAIAQETFGKTSYAPAIMAATNRKHIEDPSIARIPSLQSPIQGGEKIWIPTKEWADDFLSVWTPAKPELLFGSGTKGQLVVGSWWTAGGEAEGLHALFDIYKKYNPNVEIVNATVAGGAGFVFRAVVKPRLIAGDPPDTFQLHAGLEVQGYSPETYLTPLDDLYVTEGWTKVLPPDLLKLLRYKGHYWGIPVNIHRANVLWYDKVIFDKYNLTPPKTWDEFFSICDKLKAEGIVPFVIGTKSGYEAGHVVETILISTLGPEKYDGLWTGKTSWSDPGVTKALEIFKRMMSYANTDYPALTWDGAGEYILAHKGAMLIMGDWVNGWFMSKGYKDYGWAPVPGTWGIFDALSDTFCLPKQAHNRNNAIAWLRVCGSKEGQIAFNIRKGSIPARTDLTAADKAKFNKYLQWSMECWSHDTIVPSLIHGAAAIPSWATDFKQAINMFLVDRNVAATQKALIEAAKENLPIQLGK